jgi:hypothetical protein
VYQCQYGNKRSAQRSYDTNTVEVLTPELRIRDPVPLDPEWVKYHDPDPGSGINIPNHISESLETIFWVKILKFFDADPECFHPRFRMEKFGSATLVDT